MKLLKQDAESEETEEETTGEVEPETDEESTGEAIQQEETPSQEEEDEGQLKEVVGETERERALRAEVTRLKKQRREFKRELSPVLSKDDKDESLSKAEALVVNSLQQEALDEFIAQHPEYSESDKVWQQFMTEFDDRVPISELAKRKNVAVTKSLVMDRLRSIHSAIDKDKDNAKEEGKAELMKNQSQAAIAASVRGGQSVDDSQVVQRKRILPDPSKTSGFKSWIKK